MDAYDGDAKAPHGPDGSGGARRPRTARASDGTGEPGGPSPLTSSDVSATTSSDLSGATPSDAPGVTPSDAYGTGDDPGARAPYPSLTRPADDGGTPLPPAGRPAAARTGVAALSPRYQVGAALALAVVAVAACVHLGMAFLSVAPANTVTKQHGKAIEEWIYPEFEQNWRLFAPNPLQQNIGVQVRAQVRMEDGSTLTTGWNDLSARDGESIDGNPLPSHTQQNELRRAWEFFVATHGSDNRPVGLRGALSEQYLRRIVVMRLHREDATSRDGAIQRVQVRSRTMNVPPPEWSHEQISDEPGYRLLPWWTVPAGEAAGGVR